MSARIDYLPHGILVYGPLSLDAFAELARALDGIGCTTGDLQIAAHYGGVLIAAPYPGHRLAWRKELRMDIEGIEDVPPIAIDAQGRIVKKKRGKK